MELPHMSHVALVDGERFLLLRNSGSSAEPKLEVIETPEVEGTNFSAGVRHQDDNGQRLGRTNLTELAHAAAAAEWLNRAVLDNAIDKLMVVADPKSLGEMRRHYHPRLTGALVGELGRTLSGEPLDAIARSISAA